MATTALPTSQQLDWSGFVTQSGSEATPFSDAVA